MANELIITADNGRSTVYTRAELRRDVQAIARRFRAQHKGARVECSHISVTGASVRLCVQMKRADGWGEVVYEAL